MNLKIALLLFVCAICLVNASYVSQYRVFQVHGIPDHVGVEVFLRDRRHVLVHNRGTGNGKAGTDAEWDKTWNCGSGVSCGPWRPAKRQVTVDDLVRAGGQGYSLTSNNCYMARNRILFALTGSQ